MNNQTPHVPWNSNSQRKTPQYIYWSPYIAIANKAACKTAEYDLFPLMFYSQVFDIMETEWTPSPQLSGSAWIYIILTKLWLIEFPIPHLIMSIRINMLLNCKKSMRLMFVHISCNKEIIIFKFLRSFFFQYRNHILQIP